MSNKKRRTKRDKADTEVGTPTAVHIPHRKNQRMHLAQELRELGDTASAENLTRGLMPRFRGRVQGLRDTHYRYPGFRSTERRTIRDAE